MFLYRVYTLIALRKHVPKQFKKGKGEKGGRREGGGRRKAETKGGGRQGENEEAREDSAKDSLIGVQSFTYSPSGYRRPGSRSRRHLVTLCSTREKNQ